jgi:hypothetical protein
LPGLSRLLPWRIASLSFWRGFRDAGWLDFHGQVADSSRQGQERASFHAARRAGNFETLTTRLVAVAIRSWRTGWSFFAMTSAMTALLNRKLVIISGFF